MREMGAQPFIGSEALAAGLISWHELGKYYTAIMPNVYLDKRLKPSLRQRVIAAWLWSGRKGVIAGLRHQRCTARNGSMTTHWWS